MDALKTILGTDIPINTRGILYLCEYDRYTPKLKVCSEIFCSSASNALDLYSNIPNPESQLAYGKTFDELIVDLTELHKNMQSKKMVK